VGNRYGHRDADAVIAGGSLRRINRDKSRVGGHQAILQSQLCHLLGKVLIGVVRGLIGEVGDFHSGPDTGDALMRGFSALQVNRQGDFAGFLSHFAADANGGLAVAVESAGQDDGAADEKIGDLTRIYIRYLHAGPIYFDVGQGGMTDAIVKQIDHVGGTVVQADVGHGAFAEFGQAVQQVAIDRGADAETEYAAGAEAFVHFGENLGLVADVSVRHEADQSEPAGIVTKIQSGFDALDHHGPTAAAKAVHVFEALANIFWGGSQRTGAELRGIVGKANDLKGVVGLEFSQGSADGVFGLGEGFAAHTAGTVQYEDHFHRAPLEVPEAFGWIQHQGEEAAPFVMMGDQ